MGHIWIQPTESQKLERFGVFTNNSIYFRSYTSAAGQGPPLQEGGQSVFCGLNYLCNRQITYLEITFGSPFDLMKQLFGKFLPVGLVNQTKQINY